jgi:hypothetical protein
MGRAWLHPLVRGAGAIARFAVFALLAALTPSTLAADGVVSWDLLGQVQVVRENGRYVPRYAEPVRKLDAAQVKLQGFMIPLATGRTHTHFVLSANPSDCGFCMPGGPESYVEVQASAPFKYTLDPVVLKGRLAVLKDDPSGIFYRLVEAVPAGN